MSEPRMVCAMINNAEKLAKLLQQIIAFSGPLTRSYLPPDLIGNVEADHPVDEVAPVS